MKKFVYLVIIFSLLTSCKYVEKHNIFKKKSKKIPDIEQKIEKADSLVTDTIATKETIENFEQEKPVELITDNPGIYMITGCFLIPSNAERFAKMLREEGYDAIIVKGHSGYNMVSVKSYDNLWTAVSELNKYRTEVHPDAWIHIKRY